MPQNQVNINLSGFTQASADAQKLAKDVDALKKSFESLARSAEQSFNQITKAAGGTAGVLGGFQRQAGGARVGGGGGGVGPGVGYLPGIGAAPGAGLTNRATSVGSPAQPRMVTQNQYRMVSPGWGVAGGAVTNIALGNVLQGALAGIRSIIAAGGNIGAGILGKLPGPIAGGLRAVMSGVGGGAAAAFGFGASTFQNAIQAATAFQKGKIFTAGLTGGFEGVAPSSGMALGMNMIEWQQRAMATRRAMLPSLQVGYGTPMGADWGMRRQLGIPAGFSIGGATGGFRITGAERGRFEWQGGQGGGLNQDYAGLVNNLRETTNLTVGSIKRLLYAYQESGQGAAAASTGIARLNQNLLNLSRGGAGRRVINAEDLAYRLAAFTGAPPEQVVGTFAAANYPQMPWEFHRQMQAGRAPGLRGFYSPGTDTRLGTLTREFAGTGNQLMLTGMAAGAVSYNQMGKRVTLTGAQGANRRGFRGDFGFNVSEMPDLMQALGGFQRQVAPTVGGPNFDVLARGMWGMGVLKQYGGVSPGAGAQIMANMMTGLPNVGGGMAGQFMALQAAGHQVGMHPHVARMRMEDPGTAMTVFRNLYRQTTGIYGRGISGEAAAYALMGPMLGLKRPDFASLFRRKGQPGEPSTLERMISQGDDYEKFIENIKWQTQRITGGDEKFKPPAKAPLPQWGAALDNLIIALGQNTKMINAAVALIKTSMIAVEKMGDLLIPLVDKMPGIISDLLALGKVLDKALGKVGEMF